MEKKKTNAPKKTASKPGYVDGFLLTVPVKRLADYKKMAQLGCKVWMEHGALDFCECTGDDLKIKMGIPFPALKEAGRNDVVIFSWITYKSRAHRDIVNSRVMKDPRMSTLGGMDSMPFDCNKMSFGGFKVIVKS